MRRSALVFARFGLPLAFIAGLFFGAHSALAATLSISPSTGTYSVGQSFTETVYVTSADQAMNATQGTITFPTDKLSVLSVSKTNSIMTLWVQDPSFSNKDGVVNFGGIVVNPGFQGSNANVITITFQARNPGNANISFESGAVLANDGKGTNILLGMKNASVVLTAPQAVAPAPPTSGLAPLTITSDPPVSAGAWYNFDSITFNWNLPAGAEAVQYGISQDPNYQLPSGSQGMISQVPYDLSQFNDGIWYFVAAYESGGVWSPPATVSFGLDRTPPEPFAIVQQNSGSTTNNQPAFQWVATDKTSGIAYYSAKIGSGPWFNPETIQQGASYILPVQPSGVQTLTVRAYDRAGNFRDASVNFTTGRACTAMSFICILSIFFAAWGWLIIIFLLILLVLAYLIIYMLVEWRRRVRAELLEFEHELSHDEERFEADEDDREVDLRPSHLEKAKTSIKKERKHLEEDVEKEIRKIDKFKKK